MSVVYEIATKLSMVNGVSSVLAVVAKEVLSLEGGIKSLNKHLETTRGLLAIGGALSVAGGVGLLTALKSVADHGDKLLDQQDKLRRAGIAQNEVLRVQAQYYERIAKSVPTATASDYLRTYNEMRSIVGSERAEGSTPWALKLEAVMQNMTGKSAEGEGFKLLRALEMKGITLSDPAQADKLSDVMVKNIIGSGGKLSASDFLNIAKTGGVAWAKASPRFIGTSLSNIASDLGGERTGTAMMTFNQLLTGATKMSDQQFDEFNRLGLLNLKQVGWNKKLDQPIMGVDSIKGANLAMSDTDLWVQQYVVPALDRVYGEDQTKREQSLAILGRNRNSRRMLMMFSDPGFREQIAKDSAMWAQAHGVDQSYSEGMASNPKFVKQAFHSQYESMMQAIGAPMMQAAIPVMKAVTELFTKIGAWANANPEAIKKIAMGLAALGAVLVGSGVAAIIAAIMPASGWLILGMTALGAAFGKFPTVSLSNLVKAMTDDIPNGVRSMMTAFDILIAKFKDWIASIAGFFKGMFVVGSGQGYADAAARMRGMSVFGPSAGGRSMSAVGGGNLGFSPQGPIGSGSGSDVKSMIDQEASRAGIDPRLMYGIVAGESAHGNHYDIGDGGKSFSPFQLYRGGGLGNVFERQSGLSVRDPSNMRAMARFTAEYIRKTGDLSPWHGFHGRRNWNPSWGSMGYSPGPPPQKNDKQTKVHTDIHLDGRKIASAISTHLAKVHTHPTHAPYASRGTFMGPDHQYAVG